MNSKNELTETDISVEDIEIEDDFETVSSYLATYFDVDKKFGTNINSDDNAWLNFYAKYTPSTNELKCVYIVDTDNSGEDFSYIPTETEKALIISMIEGFCQKEYNESVSDFINNFNNEQDEGMGGISL